MAAHPLASYGADAESYGLALVPFIGTFVAGRGGVSEKEAAAWWTSSEASPNAESSTSPAPSSASPRGSRCSRDERRAATPSRTTRAPAPSSRSTRPRASARAV